MQMYYISAKYAQNLTETFSWFFRFITTGRSSEVDFFGLGSEEDIKNICT